MNTLQFCSVRTDRRPWLGAAVGCLVAILLAVSAPSSHAAVIVNGDFETGDTTGWTITGSPGSVTGVAPLAGSYSFDHDDTSGEIHQGFANALEATFLFSMNDPGGANDRGLNALFRSMADNSQINLRVVDLDSDGDGDVQVFGGGWQTIINDISFGTTHTLTLTINSFGATPDYDVTVDAASSTGLSYFQTLGGPNEFNEFTSLAFSGASNINNEGYLVDNVEVTLEVPEPSSLGLILVASGLLGRVFYGRRARPSAV